MSSLCSGHYNPHKVRGYSVTWLSHKVRVYNEKPYNPGSNPGNPIEMKKIVLKGKRIYLRPLRIVDAKLIVELAKDKSVARFTRIPHPYTIKDAYKFLRDCNKKRREGKAHNFGIFLKDNTYIGSIGIHEISRINKKCEMGYYLGKRFRRKGYMTEAVKVISKFIFNKLKLHRIEITIHPKNLRSQKLIERIGGKYEGYMREGVYLKDKFVDARLYGILEKDIKK